MTKISFAPGLLFVSPITGLPIKVPVWQVAQLNVIPLTPGKFSTKDTPIWFGARLLRGIGIGLP